MTTIETILTTEAIFSKDQSKRYLLKKTWDSSKKSMAIIMLAPSEASGVMLDSTTLLVLNNAYRLGYGSVTVLNLFSTLNDFALKEAEDEDLENIKTITKTAKTADVIIYAAGVGKAKNKAFKQRQEQVLTALRPYEKKLNCLCDHLGGSRLQHPLSPAVREWHLSPLSIDELIPTEDNEQKSNAATSSTSKP